MKSVKIILTFFSLMITLQVFGQQGGDVIDGKKFHRADKKSIIQFYKNNDTYDAKIIWLMQPKDDKGNLRLDVHNPDKNLRNRALLNLTVISGLKYSDKKWRNGQIYLPAVGMTVDIDVVLDDNENLVIIGHKLGMTRKETLEKAD
ncbi:DUF2147 domain-containing protein [Bacteroidales bacterium OttesenSCG-928-C19]|nr:DUF2147 domain-containing protein [Bacteroidales bacterium OttesenSCG-928-C19]